MENAKAAGRDFLYEVPIKQEPLEVEYPESCGDGYHAHDVKHEVEHNVKHEVDDGSDDGSRLKEATQIKVYSRRLKNAEAKPAFVHEVPIKEEPLEVEYLESCGYITNCEGTGDGAYSRDKQESTQIKPEPSDAEACLSAEPFSTGSSHPAACSSTAALTDYNKKFFICDYCNYQCAFKCVLERHMKIHTGEKPFSCTHCDFKCSLASYLRSHLRYHTGEKPYSCHQCDFKCTQASYLKTHLMSHTVKKTYSQVSNIKTEPVENEISLSADSLNKDSNDPTACSSNAALTDSDTSVKSVLEGHITKRTGEKPYSCKQCDYKCRFPSALKDHMMQHTGEKPYSCTHCNYKCSKASNLKAHLVRHNGKKQYTCELCNYKSSRVTHFRVHMATHGLTEQYSQLSNVKTEPPENEIHSSERNNAKYFCTYCDYKCMYPSGLKAHMRQHTGEKPYSCTYCCFKCSKAWNLKAHLATHMRYECEICNYKFLQASHLETHMMTHTDKNSNTSKQCSRASDLNIHMLTNIDDEKPYSCKQCDYKCSEANSLIIHIYMNHKSDTS